MALAEPLIRTDALTKRYGERTVVDRLSLEVAAGEIFGLLGPNGAGKTTTILMLLGLTEPSGGRAEVVGLDPARQPLAVKRRVGYLPDNVGFYGSLTGRENLRYTARLNGIADVEPRLDTVLREVGLPDAADSPVDTYSRGMRQRLGVADALVKQPDVVILDEPTIAIDPEGVDEMLRLMRRLAEEGAAVLLSSHLLQQVQSVCDRVGIFVAGRMVAQGRMRTLAAELGGAGWTVEVTVGDVPRAVAELRGLPGVTSVVPDERDGDTLMVSASEDVRAMVNRVLVNAGVAVLGLRSRGEALDEIYRRYFEGREQ